MFLQQAAMRRVVQSQHRFGSSDTVAMDELPYGPMLASGLDAAAQAHVETVCFQLMVIQVFLTSPNGK